MKQTRSHPGHSASGRPAEWFRDFVRQVSPTADPASVMLFVQLLRANNRLVQVAEKELSTSGLSWAKFRLLMNLEHSERHPDTKGLQPSELSEMQGISRNTASALIAFGFAIVQFFENYNVTHGPTSDHLARYLGLVMIGIGSVATAIAVWEYRKVRKYLEGEAFHGIAGVPGMRRVYPAMVVAFLLCLVGLLAFFTILLGAELPWPSKL